jgi:membrane-bound serine protease (ClpP class)
LALVVGFVLFALLDPPLGVIALAVGAVLEVGEAVFWSWYLRRYKVMTGVEGLIGERAETIEPCEPRGRVRLRNEIWSAVCEQGAGAGETVSVTAVDGLTVTVEPIGPAGPGADQRR